MEIKFIAFSNSKICPCGGGANKNARGTRHADADANSSPPECALFARLWLKTFGASRNFLFFAVNCDCSRENLCLAANTSISQRKGGAGVDGTDPDLRQA